MNLKNSESTLLAGMVLAFLLFPLPAFANAGTSLMWVSFFHLAFGNALIGFMEGLALSFILESNKFKTIGLMILANYLSAAAGVAVTHGISSIVFDQWNPLFKLRLVLPVSIALYVIFIGLTILVEWPFIAFSQTKKTRNWGHSLRTSSWIQTISAALLVPLYLSASGHSLATDLSYDKSLPGSLGNDFTFIAYSDSAGGFLETSVKGKVPTLILKYMPSEKYSSYCLSNDPQTDLITVYEKNRKVGAKPLISGIISKEELTPFNREFDKTYASKPEYRPLNPEFTNADFRDFAQQELEVWSAGWAIEGIRVTGAEHQELAKFELESPFVSIFPRNVSILDENNVLFEASGLIMVLNWREKKYCPIFKGKHLLPLRKLS